jgi:uncharacterized membrane protein YgaE (UPF0421/DUF939 family)
MYHNVAGSVRQGAQALAGLAVGIGLAVLLVNVTDPSPLAVAIFMGIGVLLGGLPGLGTGNDWIYDGGPAGPARRWKQCRRLFRGYLVQMGVGVAVGIAINFLVFPRSPECRGREHR